MQPKAGQVIYGNYHYTHKRYTFLTPHNRLIPTYTYTEHQILQLQPFIKATATASSHQSLRTYNGPEKPIYN